jgi:hypothetical protein
MLMAQALKMNREIDCEMESLAGLRRLRRVGRLPGIKNLLTTNIKIR